MYRNEYRTKPRGLADLLLADALIEDGTCCNRPARVQKGHAAWFTHHLHVLGLWMVCEYKPDLVG